MSALGSPMEPACCGRSPQGPAAAPLCPACLAILAFLLAVPGSQAAVAAPASDAATGPGTGTDTAVDRERRGRALAFEALAAYRLGHYERSIERYEAAYGLLPEPRYLYAIGTSYHRLGRLGEALGYLERFAQSPGAAALTEMLKRARERIAEIQRTTSLVTLEVAPAGARVLVEGQAARTAPIAAPLRLRNGEHRVMVTLAGHGTLQRRFQVGPGLANLVSLRLVPWSQPPRAEPPRPRREPPRPRVAPFRARAVPPDIARRRVGPPTVPTHLHDAAPRRQTDSRARPLTAVGWTGVALGGASFVAAGVLGGLAMKAKKNVEDAAQGTMWEPGLAKDYENVTRFGTGAWVASGVGAALLVTGVVLIGVESARKRRERGAWIVPAIGPGEVCLGFVLEL